MARAKECKVQVYLTPHIKKIIHIEAIKREMTMGQLVAESIIGWQKWGRIAQIRDKEKKQETEDLDRLRAEVEYYERELEALLEEQKQRKINQKRGLLK